MGTTLEKARATNDELALKNKELISFTPDQISLIKSQVAARATNDELALFLYQAKRTGLDPLARQIYAIHRGNKMTIQTSIDGFRVIAERSGDYGGQSEPDFIEQDGKLIGCKITVFRFRGEIRYPASVGVAYTNEYMPTQPNDMMWKKMPRTMIAKVAEALALRKAYPQDLSGLYIGDEMEQAPAPVTQDVSHEEISDLETWKEEIAKCKNIEELGVLYRQNAETMEQNGELKTLFSNRKKELA